MADQEVTRRLAFSCWQSTSTARPFDRIAAAKTIKKLKDDERILAVDEALTTVEVAAVGSKDKPTRFVLLALHDEASRPNSWAVGTPMRTIELADGVYTAFATHVALWPDGVAANDLWSEAPGLGRLAVFLGKKAEQRVLFRRLYRPSVAEQLADLKGWRGVEYSIQDPYKRARLDGDGLLGRFKALVGEKAPSVRVSLGMGRKGPRDAYLDDSVVDEFLKRAERAEDFFDSLVIRGLSRTKKTRKGRPATVEINLLSQRLQEPRQLVCDAEAVNLPSQEEVWKALREVRSSLEKDDVLKRAVEGRLGSSVFEQ